MLHRLLHAGDRPVLVRVAQVSADRVLFGAQAADREAAEWGIERMRLALGIDQDLSAVLRALPVRSADRSARCVPRPGCGRPGKPDPFEALAWAICEQLIEFGRAAAIQRRLIFRLGPAL